MSACRFGLCPAKVPGNRQASMPVAGDEMTPPIEHQSRRSLFHGTVVWRLDGDSLAWTSRNDSGQVPLDQIAAVRLAYAPTRFEPGRYACHVRLISGRRLAILSMVDRGMAGADDRGDSYRALVTALIERTAVANPATIFATGEPRLYYWFTLALIAMVFAAILAMAFIVGLEWPWRVAAVLMLAVASLPLLLVWLRRNRLRRLDPGAIPADMLPRAAVNEQARPGDG